MSREGVDEMFIKLFTCGMILVSALCIVCAKKIEEKREKKRGE